jgi:hypothetical protein
MRCPSHAEDAESIERALVGDSDPECISGTLLIPL